MLNNELSLTNWLTILENRYSQEIQLGLERINEVAKKLCLDTVTAKIITVAGTNGKGSTIAALESIYRTAGYQVAAYTSPHLLHFTERIRVNGQEITEEKLCEVFQLIEEGRGLIPLTYFEMTTLAALWYFKQFPLDIILLEVGLGGRLDATNMLDADLAIISTIDYDHQDFLGHSIEEIAYQKAGILKPGRPCIYADYNVPEAIRTVASNLNCGSWFLGEQYQLSTDESEFQLDIPVLNQNLKLTKPTIHVQAAASAAVASQLLSKELPVTIAALNQAMETVTIPGRLEIQYGKPNIIYDVSHNPQAARLLVACLQKQERKADSKVRAVFSALKDKDLCGLINALQGSVDVWYPSLVTAKRAATKEILANAFNNMLNYSPVIYPNPVAAFEQALADSSEADWLLVFGSFYTVSAVLSATQSIKQEKCNEICSN